MGVNRIGMKPTMPCPVLSEILDADVVARVPAHGHAYRVKTDQDVEAWVWGYLTACLATGVGYDEARDVVTMAMIERCKLQQALEGAR